MDLQDRVALITGAARGIGRTTADQLADAGSHVALLDVEAAAAQKAARDIHQRTQRRTLAVQADVSAKDQVERAVAEVLDTFGRIDVLVNNAGVWSYGRLGDVEEAEWDRVLAVNLKGVLFCTQAVTPTMKQRQSGEIVSMTHIPTYSHTHTLPDPGRGPQGVCHD